MRKLLNTLYITSEDAFLALEGETVVVEKNGRKMGQFPLINIESIICFSYCGASPALMGKCAKRNIGLAFYNPYGKFLCRINNSDNGNVLLRRAQYRLCDDERLSLNAARNIILGKVYNSRWLIDRTIRDHELRVDVAKLEKVKSYLDKNMISIRESNNMDSLRGIEGVSASEYFAIYDDLILNQRDAFRFTVRSRRPPLDKVNAMLSFGYSLLTNECASALQGVGLDPYVGFMHTDKSGRKSLALDMIEELRPVLVDRFVLTQINNRQITSKDFIETGNGAIEFSEEGRKRYLTEWQKHKQNSIRHPYLKEQIPWGLVPHVQSLLLARFIRGDIDGYPPFLWR